MLYLKIIPSPLGNLIAIADNYALYLLQFTDYKKLNAQIEMVKKDKNSMVIEGSSTILQLLEFELAAYFAGTLKTFTIPIKMYGTVLQKNIWNNLLNIPYGQKTTYKTMAEIV